jgi:Flp pilus assembly protein CpaB
VPDRALSPAGRPPAVAGDPSPRASRLARARWTDTRLLLGVLLVMTSVVAGSRVLAGATRTQQVWAARHDLAAGLRLTSQDVELRPVRLDSLAKEYLSAQGRSPAGSVLARPVSAGELLPAAAVRPTSQPADVRRQVTVPVAAFHYPADLGRGQLVDVYVTPGSDASAAAAVGAGSPAAPAVPTLVLADALVVNVEDTGTAFGGGSSSVGIVLSVPADDVTAVVAGLHQGSVDLVGVPSQ